MHTAVLKAGMILRPRVNGLALAVLIILGSSLSPASGKPSHKPPPQQSQDGQTPGQPGTPSGPSTANGTPAPYAAPAGTAPPPPVASYPPKGAAASSAGAKGNTQKQKECRIQKNCPMDSAKACPTCPVR
jgi:hypothetical protein